MAANPNTGKTTSRYLRLLAGGYNLSCDMRAVSGFGVAYDQTEVTAWCDEAKQYLSGSGGVMIDGFQALFSNEPTGNGLDAGSHVALSDLGSQYVSIFLGVRGAPGVGDDTFSAAFEQGGYTTSPSISDAVAVDASFYGSAVLPLSTYVWGKALATGATWSSTTNGVSVDGGAATSNGYIAFLHVTQTAAAQASNNWSFKIEHSANDSTWSTLGTFSANGSALVADRLSGNGTVNRYTRLVGTRTAGTARVWATIIRL
jgi:hypothetical protein